MADYLEDHATVAECYLEDHATVAECLSAVIEENDPGLLAAALGEVAKYKELRPGTHPGFETVQRVCAALGLTLEVRPAA